MLALMGYLGMFVLNGQMNYTPFDFEEDIVTVEVSPCNIYCLLIGRAKENVIKNGNWFFKILFFFWQAYYFDNHVTKASKSCTTHC